jgi:sterol 14-demethylase
LPHPDYARTVTTEIDALPDRKALAFETLARLPRLERAIKEAQRFNPVMSHFARATAMPYEIGGFVVPKTWLTMISPNAVTSPARGLLTAGVLRS